MFAKIDSELLDVFLEPEEIELLLKKPLKGKILTPEKIKAGFQISVYEEKSGKYGISVENVRGRYFVFVSQDFYEELKKSGYVGIRYGALGSRKANLFDEARLSDEESMTLAWLKKF